MNTGFSNNKETRRKETSLILRKAISCHSKIIMHPDDPRVQQAYLKIIRPQSHAPNLTLLANGDILCVWFAGSKEGRSGVGIALSRLPHQAKIWSDPSMITYQEGYSHQNPVLFYHPDQKKLYLWHTSQEDGMGQCNSNVYQLTTTDLTGQTGWSDPVKIFNKPGSFLKANPILTDEKVLLPVYYTPGPNKTHYSGIKFISRNNLNGKWKEITYKVSTLMMVQPYLIKVKDAYQIYYRDRKSKFILQSISDDGKNWSDPVQTSIRNNNCGICALTLKDGRIMIVGNNINTSRSRSPLNIFVSQDDGKTFQMKKRIEPELSIPKDHGKDAEYSYPNAVQSNDGMIHLVYTYNRETIKYLTFPTDWL